MQSFQSFVCHNFVPNQALSNLKTDRAWKIQFYPLRIDQPFKVFVTNTINEPQRLQRPLLLLSLRDSPSHCGTSMLHILLSSSLSPLQFLPFLSLYTKIIKITL